ncbi:MAG: ABC transporter permease subunit [Trueperaceae bacterium]|nr:ABC transporter permease subunit [Trueperaceae bacterium]
MAWIVAATALPSELMPGPVATVEFIAREFERGTMLNHLWATARRVVIAFGAGMIIGVAVGAAMGISWWIDRLLQGWLIAGLTIPRIILFVMAYLIFGLSDSAAINALIVTILPTIVVQVREGTRAIDDKLVEMARAYRRPRVTIWRKVILPQLMPYIIGVARSSLSLAWKMVVLAELLGRTNGVGYQISFYFQMFNMTGILAYGLTMMIILAFIDLVLLGAVQRSAFKWRKPAAEVG